ncbi:hypothetical protein NMY22_g12368 [Coprinellus aureogranulatus]|nr:hypothetical protein NMY22_g12368 [Coprinellus aureogranulatus]
MLSGATVTPTTETLSTISKGVLLYKVITSGFRSEQVHEVVQKKLRGFRAYVDLLEINARESYRPIVGQFMLRSVAEKVDAELKPLYTGLADSIDNTNTKASQLFSSSNNTSTMRLIAAAVSAIVVLPMMVNAVWCNCQTNRGDPFNDLEQTYSICAQMPGAIYAAQTLFTMAHCDVASTGLADIQKVAFRMSSIVRMSATTEPLARPDEVRFWDLITLSVLSVGVILFQLPRHQFAFGLPAFAEWIAPRESDGSPIKLEDVRVTDFRTSLKPLFATCI